MLVKPIIFIHQQAHSVVAYGKGPGRCVCHDLGVINLNY